MLAKGLLCLQQAHCTYTLGCLQTACCVCNRLTILIPLGACKGLAVFATGSLYLYPWVFAKGLLCLQQADYTYTLGCLQRACCVCKGLTILILLGVCKQLAVFATGSLYLYPWVLAKGLLCLQQAHYTYTLGCLQRACCVCYRLTILIPLGACKGLAVFATGSLYLYPWVFAKGLLCLQQAHYTYTLGCLQRACCVCNGLTMLIPLGACNRLAVFATGSLYLYPWVLATGLLCLQQAHYTYILGCLQRACKELAAFATSLYNIAIFHITFLIIMLTIT